MRAIFAGPPLRGKTDNDARPPLSVDGVGQVSNVEGNDRGVNIRSDSGDDRARLREAVCEPERNWEEESKEDGKRHEPVRFADSEPKMNSD